MVAVDSAGIMEVTGIVITGIGIIGIVIIGIVSIVTVNSAGSAD